MKLHTHSTWQPILLIQRRGKAKWLFLFSNYGTQRLPWPLWSSGSLQAFSPPTTSQFYDVYHYWVFNSTRTLSTCGDSRFHRTMRSRRLPQLLIPITSSKLTNNLGHLWSFLWDWLTCWNLQNLGKCIYKGCRWIDVQIWDEASMPYVYLTFQESPLV